MRISVCFFDEINDVLNPSTETGGDVNIPKVPPPTTDQMLEVMANLDSSPSRCYSSHYAI